MEVEVRSDFKLALRVRDANGRTRTVGHYSKEIDESMYVASVPHLQRVDPSGEWLASYDVDRSRIVMNAIHGGASSFRVALDDAPDEPEQFRWLADGSGMVVVADDQVHLLPLDPSDAPTRTRPKALLPERTLPYTIDDVRVMDGGLLVRITEQVPVTMPAEPVEFRTGVDLVFGGERLAARPLSVGHPEYWDYHYEYEEYDDDDNEQFNSRGQALFVALEDGKVTSVEPMVGPDQSVTGAMPLSGGRVVAAVAPFSLDPWAYPEADVLWISTPSATGWTGGDKTACDDGCPTRNWAPGAEDPIRATSDSVIVHRGASQHEFEMPGYGVNVLWADPTGKRLMAATDEAMVLWEGGVESWRYTAPDEDLRSARFDPAGRFIYATVNGQILRFSVENGESQRVAKIRSYERVHDQEGDEGNEWMTTTRTEFRRLDGVVPLPGGGVAYAVLEAEEEESYY